MGKDNPIKISVVQMSCSPDPQTNLRRAMRFIEEAADREARVVSLPELFRTTYFCQREDVARFDLAEPVPGPTTEALAAIARQRRIVIVAPVFERRAPGVYHNSAAVIDSTGEIAGVYRKMHVPDDPGYYEKFYFTPGDLGFRAFNTAAGKLGALICWDQWYPEGSRLTALRGAEILYFPTAIGWHPHEKAAQGPAQLDAWRTIQRAHAIANGVYAAVPNRVGLEKDPQTGAAIEFWGSSFIADPAGVVVAQASDSNEEVLIAEFDRQRLEDVRRNWPFLRDRRVDAYDGLSQRWLEEPRSS